MELPATDECAADSAAGLVRGGYSAENIRFVQLPKQLYFQKHQSSPLHYPRCGNRCAYTLLDVNYLHSLLLVEKHKMKAVVEASLQKSIEIRKLAVPLPNPDTVGWGKAGTALEGIHLKTAALQSLEIVRSKAISEYPSLLLPSQNSKSLSQLTSARSVMAVLVDHRVTSIELASAYVRLWEDLRFSDRECSEEEYLRIMKIVARIFQVAKPSRVPN
ncbi:hypothetical protein HK098_002977 [Nowakowskiella sp. JEL0407]|nr:hypothetical protein HK098_002977 [Nowakowskiella sp. JEL0407]